HRLAAPDLTRQQDVGVGENLPVVEDPRVEHEGRTGPVVDADENPTRTESLLGQERVGDSQDVAGGPMWFNTEPPPGPPRLRSSLTPSGHLRCRCRLRQLGCCPLLLCSPAVVQHLSLELLGGLISSLLTAARCAVGHHQQVALALTTGTLLTP